MLRRSPLVLAAALVLAACGGSDAGGGGDAARSTDRAFAAAMVPHHESAVEMAEIALRRAQSPRVKQLAQDIVRSQREEIATLRAQDADLAAQGVQPGSLGLSEHDAGMHGSHGSLETAEPFDAAFVEQMLPHHEGAVQMARIELERGADPELKQLAQEIIEEQEREIELMRSL